MRIVASMLLVSLAAGCALDPAATSPPDAAVAPVAMAAPARVTLPADPAIAGTWMPRLAELGGKEFKFGQDFRLVVNGDRYELYGAPQGKDTGSLVFMGGDPRALDVVGGDGPSKGKRFPAIYRILADGSLEVCYDLDGKERPAAFVTLEGTQLFRVVYKRR
jgi:uncharacterized protein (TIGR03067 family)